MKLTMWTFNSAIALFITTCLSSGLTAANPHEQSNMHHKYKVEVIGTFGGPNSSMEQPGDEPEVPFVRILNRTGTEIGTGQTSTLDPYCFLGGNPCYTGYVFRFRDGVESNLGALPENASTGPQTPCVDCTWSAFAYGIADNGFVAGESENNTLDSLTRAPTSLAVLWTDHEIVSLGTLGGNESAAAAVNNRGEVVGSALTLTPDPFPGVCQPMACDFFIFGYGTEAHAFLWRDGSMLDLGTLGGPDSAAFFVNNRGDIAGASDVDYASFKTIENPVGGPTVHPFLWKHGRMIDLLTDAPPGMFGGTYGMVSALNDRGQVTGTMNLTGDALWHSFLWEDGAITDLDSLGGINTTATWMNNAGHVVGRSDITAICTACPEGNQKQLHHPFLWKDGAMTDLGLLYGDTFGTALSINSKDQIVGHTGPCTTVNANNDGCDSPLTHSFLWENGSMVDVQSLLVAGSGVTLDCPTNGPLGCVGAYNINDRGEIAAQGVLANGATRALLLIPCDGDHPDVDGCEYDMDVTASPQIGTQRQNAKMTPGVYAATQNPWIRRGAMPRR